ncbi:Ig-like domain-containing protein [Mesorhizobium sp. GbtcB19]|uniref:beta strand repeat-containing protein n=1 Tax=Mesorhizobium sp. GbtcB19 TaxID=2824764 RepID=UPI001C303663|nr:Ig-like domain-containing protein [Mesorhizobium sp. GbtcB19]
MTSSSQITTQFSGISDTSSDPPHNALAVGPSNIVTAEGSQIEWTDLSGGTVSVESVYQFFGSLGPSATNALFDPRAVYDSVNNRYVVTIDNLGSNGAISNIDIAVSKDSNPNDGWYFYSLNTSLTINGQLTAADQPILSLDGTNIYITAPQYGVNVSGFAGTEQWVIGDTAGAGGGIYNGGTMTVVANQVASPNQGIARVVAGNNGQTYYASAENTGSQTLITLQTYNLATNSFGPTTTVSLGNVDQGGGGSDYTAEQQGTSVLLDAGDANIQNLAYSNGFLYGVSEVMPAGSSTPQVHWFKVDVTNPSSPALVAQGNISGAAIGSGVATFDGSIAVDQAGDVIINYTASGPGMYPADYYSFMAAGDPSGTFSAPVLYQASSSYLANGDGGNVQRWGNNSSATADPSDPNSFWLSGEYVANGWWQTSVAQVAIQTPTANVTERLSKDTGASSSDKITSNAKIVGTGVANAVVSFTVDGNAVATTMTANAGGAWTFTPTGLTDGQHTIIASETGAPGNPSPASLTFTLDTTSPTVAIANAGGAIGQAALTVTGTVSDPDVSGPGSTVAIFDGTTQVGTAIVQADGTWSTGISLTNGTNSLTARDTDVAGNVGISAPVTYTITMPSSSIQTMFAGISDPSDDPPDNGLAVGPGNIVMAEGQRVEWTNLAGGAVTNMSAYNFFPPLGGAASWTGSLKDTFSAYDAVNNRFVYSTENLNPHTSPGSTSEVFAVSKDGNPNDGWFFGSINTSTTINGVATESDEPTLAVDGTNIYIASPQYNATGPGYMGSELWVIGDTAGVGGGIYNGGTATVIATQLTDPNLGVFRDVAGNNGKTYFASAYDSGGQSFMALQVYDVATNTFGSVANIAFGNIDQGNGGTTYYAQQQGSNVLLDVDDGRIGNLVYANGFLYGTNEVQSPGSSVPNVHWFKIDVSNPANPVLAAQGTISGDAIGTNVATFNGSIAVDAAGDVIINFNASGPNMLPSDYYVLGKTDNLSFGFTTPVLYQASSQPFALDTNRWGANSSAVVDPNNPNTFWISSEYIANNWWQTAVAQVAVQGPPTIASISASGTGIAGGNGDLNAGSTVTLTVNFSQAVTVNTAGGSPRLLLSDGGIAAYSGGSGTAALTFSYTVAAGENTLDLIVSSFDLNGSTIADGMANSAIISGATNYNPAGTLRIDTTTPSIASIATSGAGITNGNGDVNAGKTVTLTVNFSEAVTVNTAGGSPRLLLNDGGIATYSGGSGTAALTFSYTVTAGQNTPDLTVSSLDLNGSSIADGATNSADISAATNYVPAGTLQVDTTIPTITGIATSGAGITNGDGDLKAGKTVTLTVTFSEAVTVNTAGGSPRLLLNDGGIATYSGGSGTTALTFSYTVASGQNTPDLTVSSLSLNGSTITDPASNNANLLGANNYNPAGTLQIDTSVPTIASISTSGAGITNGNGDLNAGKTVTLTVTFNQAVAVNTAGGSPRLLLNDGGIATYSGGSGTTALIFSYTVAAGQNTSDLTVSSFSLNGSTITDPATNNANLSGATNYNPAGTLQIDTTATIAINTIAGNNNVNGLEALTGFAISGTSTGVENGQIVTVNILNSQNIVVDSYSTADQNNAWSVNVTSAQAQALADGAYTVTADVADKAGNLAPLATRALIVDQDKTPEAPILAIANTALTVQAHGSVALGITATPIDSDDSVTLRIAGLPSYEAITAPSGYHVSKALQLNGTYTWTITENSSTVGKPISGLALTSSYNGTSHPVATLTVTASNSTLGETASAPSQTMTVTDPPATTTNPTSNLLALFNQYSAWGFHDGHAGAGEIAPAWSQHGGHDLVALLATPGHFER